MSSRSSEVHPHDHISLPHTRLDIVHSCRLGHTHSPATLTHTVSATATHTYKRSPPPPTRTQVSARMGTSCGVSVYAWVSGRSSLGEDCTRYCDATQAKRLQRFFRRRWAQRRWVEVSAARTASYIQGCRLRLGQWHARVRAFRATRSSLCAAAGVLPTLRPCFRKGYPPYPGGVVHAGLLRCVRVCCSGGGVWVYECLCGC